MADRISVTATFKILRYRLANGIGLKWEARLPNLSANDDRRVLHGYSWYDNRAGPTPWGNLKTDTV